jgi:hypothetical protein
MKTKVVFYNVVFFLFLESVLQYGQNFTAKIVCVLVVNTK